MFYFSWHRLVTDRFMCFLAISARIIAVGHSIFVMLFLVLMFRNEGTYQPLLSTMYGSDITWVEVAPELYTGAPAFILKLSEVPVGVDPLSGYWRCQQEAAGGCETTATTHSQSSTCARLFQVIYALQTTRSSKKH